MLLAIDAGNTNVVFALMDGAQLLGQWRIKTERERTADEYGVWLMQLLERAGHDPRAVTGAIIASVVPQAMFALTRLCRDYFHNEPLIIGAPGVEVGMPIKVDRPEEVGADRIVNAVAAFARYRKALMVIDFGTATTFDVVNQAGEYIGGVIATGIHLSLEALQHAAAKLPTIDIAPLPRVIGTNTVAAMQSGIYYGYLSLIEGLIARIEAEHVIDKSGGPMHVVATGGLAPLFAQGTARIHATEPDLTLDGLRQIYARNRAA